MTTTFNKDEISRNDVIDRDEVLKMARQAGLEQDGDMWFSNLYKTDMDVHISHLEAFAKLVDAKATAKATDEANARANASWTLMCKKMVEAEREACAKVCEAQEDKGGEWDVQQQCANAIRARGQ